VLLNKLNDWITNGHPILSDLRAMNHLGMANSFFGARVKLFDFVENWEDFGKVPSLPNVAEEVIDKNLVNKDDIGESFMNNFLADLMTNKDLRDKEKYPEIVGIELQEESGDDVPI
jgi:hypothetical protein